MNDEIEHVQQSKGEGVVFALSEEALKNAHDFLDSGVEVNEPVDIPFGAPGLRLILSRNPNDMIALEEIVYDGKKYYLGIPQE